MKNYIKQAVINKTIEHMKKNKWPESTIKYYLEAMDSIGLIDAVAAKKPSNLAEKMQQCVRANNMFENFLSSNDYINTENQRSKLHENVSSIYGKLDNPNHYHKIAEGLQTLCESLQKEQINYLGSIINYFAQQELQLSHTAQQSNAAQSSATQTQELTTEINELPSKNQVDSIRAEFAKGLNSVIEQRQKPTVQTRPIIAPVADRITDSQIQDKEKIAHTIIHMIKETDAQRGLIEKIDQIIPTIGASLEDSSVTIRLNLRTIDRSNPKDPEGVAKRLFDSNYSRLGLVLNKPSDIDISAQGNFVTLKTTLSDIAIDVLHDLQKGNHAASSNNVNPQYSLGKSNFTLFKSEYKNSTSDIDKQKENTQSQSFN
jgi:cell fate (sporulation/competence/biofilm development) regulator YmcA (YheA/YmcA/DUF963 family)